MLLARRKIVSMREIYNELWGLRPYSDMPSTPEKHVHVQVHQIRRKLRTFGITVRSTGHGTESYTIPERKLAKLLAMAL